ncbi:U24-ctenitoxin-Pn1a-like [Centruroides sculpturatus]|uniref:U24-ctenitoxin-Pn1a-like n=1 Tax=Centruroides sculpturatus TaxID=218467 RepID=UPI000C6D93D6|nr:U24-ctenitoxin-Pn1a-like [Centruroides sculpturatus]
MKFLTIIFFILFTVALTVADEEPEEPEGICAEARRKSSANDAKVKIVYECEDDDTFVGLQCYQHSKFCACYSRDGQAISSASTKLRRCECLREADIQMSKEGETYVPTCEEDGSYFPKQCDEDKCWCVNSHGEKISEPTTGDIEC